jgi:ATP-dependent RNA helicase DeaD
VGYVQPTPIQVQFIPIALSGRDVMGQARTGTGKTAAFLLPLFCRLQPGAQKPRALILAPTRELALQIQGELGKLGEGLGFQSVTLYGGSGYDVQNMALTRGVDLVVGTPGRLMDHMRSRRLDLSEIQTVVLDEADRMLDLGFRKDIEYILRHCPTSRQTLLLSATIPDEILKLARRFMREPEELWLTPDKPAVEQIEQFYCIVEPDQKLPLLLKILDEERPGLAIVFCRTKLGARKLAARMQALKLNAREIHGDLVQSKREKIMGHFRKGRVRLLVATDVASRGIDVDNITHIINYDVPHRAEDYVHRIGRTGRMDRCGKAFTLVTREDAPMLTEIELFVNQELHLKQYADVNSIFWPNPPESLPPEFGGDNTEMVAEQDYVEPSRKGDRGKRRERGPRKREPRARHPHASAPMPAPAEGAVATAGEPPAAAEGGGNGAPSSGERRRRRSGQRKSVPTAVTCSACGQPCTVNFQPKPGRPVYCDPCYAALRKPDANRTADDPK